jgi:BirA family biotin operon repressor/biotin-[acetyl-CoA-carboxylase] ligase
LGQAEVPPDIAKSLDELRERRPDLVLRVCWHASVSSTMDLAAEAAEAGTPQGLVVGADEQTAGRGRRGRGWSSPHGAGLYFSYLARPRRYLPLTTLGAGVAVRGGIAEAARVEAHLKWPNDVMVGRRKLAGILAEGLHIGLPNQAVVIGVGVNVIPGEHSSEIADRIASIVGLTGGAPPPRASILVAILEHLSDALAALDRGESGDILREWRLWAPGTVGSAVEWDTPAGLAAGVTAGVDESGALLVETPTGVERLVAGEIRWRGARSP